MIRQNETFVSVIRVSPFFPLMNRVRDPPPLYDPHYSQLGYNASLFASVTATEKNPFNDKLTTNQF